MRRRTGVRHTGMRTHRHVARRHENTLKRKGAAGKLACRTAPWRRSERDPARRTVRCETPHADPAKATQRGWQKIGAHGPKSVRPNFMEPFGMCATCGERAFCCRPQLQSWPTTGRPQGWEAPHHPCVPSCAMWLWMSSMPSRRAWPKRCCPPSSNCPKMCWSRSSFMP